MVTILRQTDADPVGELTPSSFNVVLVTTDGVGGQRFPTAGEMTGASAKLSVIDVGTAGVVNSLNAVNLLPTHGVYTAATGLLVVNLAAADNPMVAGGATDRQPRRALVYVPGLCWAEVLFTVQAAESGVP